MIHTRVRITYFCITKDDTSPSRSSFIYHYSVTYHITLTHSN